MSPADAVFKVAGTGGLDVRSGAGDKMEVWRSSKISWQRVTGTEVVAVAFRWGMTINREQKRLGDVIDEGELRHAKGVGVAKRLLYGLLAGPGRQARRLAFDYEVRITTRRVRIDDDVSPIRGSSAGYDDLEVDLSCRIPLLDNQPGKHDGANAFLGVSESLLDFASAEVLYALAGDGKIATILGVPEKGGLIGVIEELGRRGGSRAGTWHGG